MPERPGRSGVSPVRSCPIANTAAQDRDKSFPFSLRQLGGKEGDLEGKSVQPMDATEAFGRSEISDHLPPRGTSGLDSGSVEIRPIVGRRWCGWGESKIVGSQIQSPLRRWRELSCRSGNEGTACGTDLGGTRSVGIIGQRGWSQARR